VPTQQLRQIDHGLRFMNYNDRVPAHFHARHQDQEVLVEIETDLVTGAMHRRALQRGPRVD
jgi:hypothetical protein